MVIQTVRARRIGRFIFTALFVFLAVVPAAPGQVQDRNVRLPQRVLIIRHAEKPEQDETSIHLSPEGRKHANELYRLFKESEDRPSPFPTPVFIFAAGTSKHSNRSVETVTPLAQRLKRNINQEYRDEDYEKLAHEILTNRKYAGKTILVSWHHGTIPELANRLKATDAPKKWKDSVFDRVWQIDYDKEGQATFQDLPQQLLEPQPTGK